ncbi:DUF3253 domain-containing protein [Sphingomonas sp. RP10(2022)]|uniref:DUF3253 domain-containing protein n=1 Tax=Sphingomonas liriopis TaxID=2949094 RepID=A0A9X2HQG4_9SPHN|nr:DUF3253 domain-containing protein [Sphingomonas liriopis]MCP3734582.1 DUF3253 domain-containing protein [Sphingomonas liriopis]
MNDPSTGDAASVSLPEHPSHSTVRDTALALLAVRSAGATICPSEVARALVAPSSTGDWRRMMPIVHAAIDDMVGERLVRLSWKGKPLAVRAGPYRIQLTPNA